MSMGGNVGEAYIEIGVKDSTDAGVGKIEKNVHRSMQAAGKKAGAALADGLTDAAERAGNEMVRNLSRDIDRIEDDLDDLTKKKRKIHVEVELDSKVARAEMFVLQRDRVANIYATVKGNAEAKLTAIVSGLSGFSLIGSFTNSLVMLSDKMPQMVLKLGGMATALTSIGAPALNAASAIGPLVSSLGALLPLVLAAPAALGGLAAAGGVVVASFVDLEGATTKSGKAASRLIDRLKDKFGDLQNVIQGNFWDGLIGPMKDLTNKLFPQLESGLAGVATAMGQQWGAVASTISGALGSSGLDTFFANVQRMIAASTPGFQAFAAAFTVIAQKGSEVLPALGEWVTRIGEAFNNWAQNADIAGLIQNAVDQLYFLVDAAEALWGIISGVFKAMDTGRSTGLESISQTLQKISDVINGPAFQTNLGMIFEAAAKGAETLSGVIEPLGGFFAAAAPVISHALDAFSGAALDAITGIADALSSEDVQNGMIAAIDGLAKMIESIDWAAFGDVVAHIGKGIGAVAPGMADLVNAILPFLPGVIDGFVEIANVIGLAAPPLIEFLTPLLSSPGLVAGVIGAFAGWKVIGPAVSGVTKTVQFMNGAFGAAKTAQELMVGGMEASKAAQNGLKAKIVATTAATKLQTAATKIGTAATKVGTGIQKAFNLVLKMNPIGLIITAIMLLVGALVWFFTQTELGKEIFANVMKFIGDAFTWLNENVIQPVVDAIVTAWEWLQDAVTILYENYIKPVFDAIAGVFETIWGVIEFIISLIVNYFRFWGALITWVWENLIQPALKAIGDFFTWLWEQIIKAVIDFIVGAIEWLGDMFTWLWENAIQPALQAIGDFFQWIWDNVIQPIIDFIIDYIELWGKIFTWLYENIVQPVFKAIGDAFTWIWENVIQPIIDFVIGAIEGWGKIFTWLYENVIKPVWEGIQDAFESAWNWINDHVFTPFKDGIQLIQDGFQAFADAIPAIWEGIKKAVADPINFVLDEIWNKKLRKFWNDLVVELKLPDMQLKAAPLVSFAKGGVLPGYTPGRDVHQFFSPTGGRLALSGGEGIIRPDALRRLGGKAWLDAVNGSRGKAIGDGQGDKSQGMLGDAFAWVADAVAVVGDFLLNPVNAIDKYLVKGIIQPLIGDQNIFGKTIAGLASNTVKSFSHMFDFLAPSDGTDAPANAIGWKKMWAMVQAVAPWAVMTSAYRSPASNAAAGGVKGSYHTQGRAIDLVPASMKTFNMAKALFPNARELIYTPAGKAQLLNGQPYAGWSDYVKKIHHNHVHVAMRNGGIFDGGGMLGPGGMGMNLTRKPEAVFTSAQFALLERNVAQMDSILGVAKGYRAPSLFGAPGAGGFGQNVNNSRNVNVNEGAFQLSGPDPYEVSLMTVNRLAEKVAL